jgi:hypothetical protein
LVGFLLRLVPMHTRTMSRVQKNYRSIWGQVRTRNASQKLVTNSSPKLVNLGPFW